jgi:hypothetical protein
MPSKPMKGSHSLRKKNSWQKARQVARIWERAKSGITRGTLRRELSPFMNVVVEQEKLLERNPVEEAIQKKAKIAFDENMEKMSNRIQQISLSRALTLSGVFSTVKRRQVRIVMNYFWHKKTRTPIVDVRNRLKKIIGFRSTRFMNVYHRSIIGYNDAANEFMDKRKNEKE